MVLPKDKSNDQLKNEQKNEQKNPYLLISLIGFGLFY